MSEILLKSRSLEHVKVYWEKSQDEEFKNLFPFNGGTLNDSIKLFEESLKPDARSFGNVIYIDNSYIGDVWCYGIDESIEKHAFVSIVIFDKRYWGKGIGKYVLKEFSQILFNKYSIIKLCAFTYADNKRSIATLESVGFKMIEEFEEEGKLSYYYELVKR